MTNEQLIEQFQQWNTSAFDVLYENNLDSIYKFIFYKVGNQTDAQDITSETFLKIYKNLDKFDPDKAQFKTWAYTIAYRTLIDFSKQRGNYAPYEWLENEAENPDLIEKLTDEKRLWDIMKFLDWLDPTHKQIFMMKIWENMSYEEIAEIIGQSPNACKQIFYRTMKKLTERFTILLLFCIIHGINI